MGLGLGLDNSRSSYQKREASIMVPVNADDHEYEGGEDIAPCPEHHQHLACDNDD